MAITQLHGILFANQNMQVVASKQIDLQGRIDFQNIVATASTNEKQRQIDETRAAEEGKGISPDREHNRERADEETGEKETKTRREFDKKLEDDEDYHGSHILDIKA